VITAYYKIVASAEQKEVILESLRSFMGPTEVKPGCVRCSISQDLENPDTIVYTEEWHSETHLENHLRSPRYRELLAIIDSSASEPEVRFYTTGEIKGMEYLESIRLKKREEG
jgi:quinol monooxygenase YgiN